MATTSPQTVLMTFSCLILDLTPAVDEGQRQQECPSSLPALLSLSQRASSCMCPSPCPLTCGPQLVPAFQAVMRPTKPWSGWLRVPADLGLGGRLHLLRPGLCSEHHGLFTSRRGAAPVVQQPSRVNHTFPQAEHSWLSTFFQHSLWRTQAYRDGRLVRPPAD